MQWNPREFMTVGRAARKLGVSATTVNRWIEDGTLRAYRFGFCNYRYIPLEDINQLAVKRAARN
jgi:excisionase family DNA binding protein